MNCLSESRQLVHATETLIKQRKEGGREMKWCEKLERWISGSFIQNESIAFSKKKKRVKM